MQSRQYVPFLYNLSRIRDMRLTAPTKSPMTIFRDAEGRTINTEASENIILMAFFRDTHCPFCNYRIYELTQRYEELHAQGLDIIAVFSADLEDVQRFNSIRKRPFPIVADPESFIYEQYGIESSNTVKNRSIMRHFTAMFKGLFLTGLKGLTVDSEILPADFLVSANGNIVATHYGEDYGDRIPIEVIQSYLEIKNS